MVSPRARQFVNERLCRVGIFINRHDRKIGNRKGVHQADEGDRRQREDRKGRPPAENGEPGVISPRADKQRRRLRHGHGESENECEVTNFRCHAYRLWLPGLSNEFARTAPRPRGPTRRDKKALPAFSPPDAG